MFGTNALLAIGATLQSSLLTYYTNESFNSYYDLRNSVSNMEITSRSSDFLKMKNFIEEFQFFKNNSSKEFHTSQLDSTIANSENQLVKVISRTQFRAGIKSFTLGFKLLKEVSKNNSGIQRIVGLVKGQFSQFKDFFKTNVFSDNLIPKGDTIKKIISKLKSFFEKQMNKIAKSSYGKIEERIQKYITNVASKKPMLAATSWSSPIGNVISLIDSLSSISSFAIDWLIVISFL